METIELSDGGILLFRKNFFSPDQADNYFIKIRDTCSWVQHPGLFGRPQPRLTASYGDPGLVYRYSKTVNVALPWIPDLLEIKYAIEKVMGIYNYCLLNRYRSGTDSMGLHADDEPEMGNIIGSISLGATRQFRIRHKKNRETRLFQLDHGTLVVMGGTMQQFWKHEVPKTREVIGERINLTFRQVLPVPDPKTSISCR